MLLDEVADQRFFGNVLQRRRQRRYRIEKSWRDRLRSVVPFGLGATKPKHFRDMLRIVWRNRDNLGYAWKVISKVSMN